MVEPRKIMQTSSTHVLTRLSADFSFAPTSPHSFIAHLQRKLGGAPGNPNLFVDAFEIQLHILESKARKIQDVSWQLLRAENVHVIPTKEHD